jgi:hypothetical protein
MITFLNQHDIFLSKQALKSLAKANYRTLYFLETQKKFNGDSVPVIGVERIQGQIIGLFFFFFFL